ncbi:MAG: hypothetical protein QM741_11005 [Rudaea sp.]|uniref:hypothetical protein n=1 Tax=Rudaea sp. TaxID=2136325 RepID=UPI0039E5286C
MKKPIPFFPKSALSSDCGNTGHFFSLAGAVILAFSSLSAFAVIPAAERTVLSNLYAYTDGWYWSIPRDSWNGPPGSECTWYGITCDASQSHVVAIDLTGISLTGTLPPLAPLSQLQSLKLSNLADAGSPLFNNLWGAIPELKGLSQLREVQLGNQHFSGAIPDLSGLSELSTLNLINNQLTGSLPSLTGLGQLQTLQARINQLDGSLPSFDDLTQLTDLDLGSNFFSGGIPSIGKMANLQTFRLDGNRLDGSVPSLSGLTRLNEFEVEENLLDGALPDEISDLPNLQGLYASINFLTGTVPVLANVPSLQQFDVSVNQLTDQPPAPPSNAGFQEYLCPNPLTPASDPPTSIDVALNLVSPVTPWSTPCTQTPVESVVRGIAYVGPATADGKTVTIEAAVYGRNPAGTVTVTYSGIIESNYAQITVCDNVPVIASFATCRFQADGDNWSGALGLSYSGDANNQPATYPAHSRVAGYRLSLSSSSVPVQADQAVDLVATLTSTPETFSAGNPADTLSFYDGETLLCAHVPIDILAPKQTQGATLQIIPTVTARCTTSFATPGDHVLTVKNDNALELGAPSPPLTQTVVAAAPFDGDQFGVSGTWYNPYTSGQGLVLTTYVDGGGAGVGELFGGWFTFDALGNAQWRTLQGKLPSARGASYDLTIYSNTGGNFNAPPKATAVVDGTATLTFHDCTHATLDYQLNDGRSGSLAEARLSVPTVCSTNVPAISFSSLPFGYDKAFLSGAWYDPQTSGQGLVVDVIPPQSLLFAAWYAYAPQAEGQSGAASQRWFTVQAPYSQADSYPNVTQAPIYAVTGGLFDKATRTAGLPVGTADITFTSNSTMTIAYTFTAGEFAGLCGTISAQKIAGGASSP